MGKLTNSILYLEEARVKYEAMNMMYYYGHSKETNYFGKKDLFKASYERREGLIWPISLSSCTSECRSFIGSRGEVSSGDSVHLALWLPVICSSLSLFLWKGR